MRRGQKKFDKLTLQRDSIRIHISLTITAPLCELSNKMSKRNQSAKTPTKAVSDAPITHSIIVPAYKEKLNLRPLTTRIFTAFNDSESPIPAENVEVIIVDDNSRDGSVEEVEVLRDEGYNIRIIVRTNERGLSSAVVRGFKEAKGDSMICMDADLQVYVR
jgi:cellulose synthase/poly-beta-1,6-N-acetylglucosamine synthase-like glycosyltransferase